MSRARARAYSNIAFIKYWGNRDSSLRLPVNGSLSMNLAGLETITTVDFDADADRLTLNGEEVEGDALTRVSSHLDILRDLAGVRSGAVVTSDNTFPMGAGIASSASAFAALTLAGAAALGLDLSEADLSRIARRSSGSASRSVPAGFVEWYAADTDGDSFAESIAPVDHWALTDLVAVVSREHKAVGSTGGHALAPTSPLQEARIADADRRLDQCRAALLTRDFEAFAEVVEHDALIMHAVMMTSRPALIYWEPTTLALIEKARAWRAEGIPVCFTIDAGANVHFITEEPEAIQDRLATVEGVQDVLSADVGGAAHIIAG